MSTDVDNPPEKTAASLVSGILGDLHRLVGQQFELTRREIEDELRQRLAAAAVFGLGVGAAALAAMAFCLASVHWVHWITSPAGMDPAWLPLWACHAGAGACLSILGGVLAQVGRGKFQSVVPCQNPSGILEEQVPWTTPPK